MLVYIAKRLVFVIPVVFAVALVCFLLVHIAPGDPLVSVLPPDASQALAEQMRKAYGFDRPLPVQFGIWLWNALHGNLGTSIATGRSVAEEVSRAVGNTLMLAVLASLIGFVFGVLFGFLAGYFRDTWIDKLVTIDLDHRRVDAALLARHGAGDHLLGAARLAAGGRRRARRLGVGLGALPAPDPAGRHHVGDPDGHRHAHRARAGRRSALARNSSSRCAPRA